MVIPVKKQFCPTFFLAANSADGFYSRFKDCYRAENGWRAYIIKGGPGTGKSHILRRVAAEAQKKGVGVVFCPCSSDPSSLDAVILSDIKTVLLDGTAPHVVEPMFPAVCEQIINTGDFWDTKKFAGKESEVIALSKKNSAAHRRASQYIAAAGQLMKYNFSTALSATDIEKAFSFGVKLSEKNIPKKRKGRATEWVRFLGGITPDGFLFYGDTPNIMCRKKIILSDEYGAASSIILSAVRDRLETFGYEFITVKNPVLPSDITDAIIIPELSLAILTENRSMKIECNDRRIHARRFMNMTELHKNRQRVCFNRKASGELISMACETLREAKLIHDDIEKYYVAAMDFTALENMTDQIIKKIF